MGKSIMQMDQVALADIKSGGYMVVAKTGQNNRVALSEIAKQSDVETLDTDIGKIGGSIAPAYSSLTFPVSEGTLCMYARRLYTCSASGGIPASEEWTAGHWTQTRVSEIIGNVEQLLAAL